MSEAQKGELSPQIEHFSRVLKATVPSLQEIIDMAGVKEEERQLTR